MSGKELTSVNQQEYSMLASTKHNLEDFEFIEFQSAKEVCSESATYPNLNDFYFLDEERNQITCATPHIKNEITLEFDVSSGTYQLANITEEIPFVNSPFDELDERLPDEAKMNRSLVSVKRNKNISYAQRLADRLRDLYESVLKDPEEGPIPHESLLNFLYFLSETPGLRYPDVNLTQANEIRAQWRTAPNRHFAVSFSSMGDARFVIFKPNSDDPDRIDRLSGITSVATLIETTRPHRVLEWTSQ
jgi:hypothetical protein